jgi:transposase
MSEDAGMRQFDFPQAIRDQIDDERFEHPNAGVRRRMEILWLKAHDEEHERIAQLAAVSRPTVQRVLDLYWTGGLAAVRVYHWKTPTSVLTAFAPQVAAEFDRQPPHTTEEACQRIARLTGVKRGPTQVRHFLHDTLQLRWRKTAAVPLPPKQTLAEHAAQQAAFLKDGA